MNKFAIVLALAAVAATSGAANAATANARLGGSVANSCTLTTLTDGIMALNVDGDVFGSQVATGAAATVRARSTGPGFNVSAIAPAGFEAGSPVSAGTTFAAEYDISGPTTATNVAGATTTPIGRGTHTVSVDLTATNTAGFANGTYAAIVTVRCE